MPTPGGQGVGTGNLFPALPTKERNLIFDTIVEQAEFTR